MNSVNRISILALCSALLLSCGGGGTAEYEGDSYSPLGHRYDASAIIASAALKMPYHLIVTSESCAACERLLPKYGGAVQALHYDIGVYSLDSDNQTEFRALISTLQDAYGSEDAGVEEDAISGVDGATPRLYRFDENGCTRLYFYNDTDNAQRFRSYLENAFTPNRIMRFADVGKFSAYLEGNPDALSFLYDMTDEASRTAYASSLYGTASKKDAPLAVLDWSLLSASDQEEALSLFSVESYAPTIKKGGESASLLDGSSAELLSSYYEGVGGLSFSHPAIEINGDLL
jgi:hypothetical protein